MESTNVGSLIVVISGEGVIQTNHHAGAAIKGISLASSRYGELRGDIPFSRLVSKPGNACDTADRLIERDRS